MSKLNRAKAEVSYNTLKALLIFASTSDIRFYLNGIKIEGDKLIASDGHRMLINKLDEAKQLDAIIPRKEIETALYLHQKLHGRNKKNVPIIITKRTIGNVIYKAIDGTYPNWEKIVDLCPADYKETSNIQVNGTYISDFAKARKLINGSSAITIYGNNDLSPYIVAIDPEQKFFGIVMPIRRGDESSPIPEWIAKAAENVKQKEQLPRKQA